MKQQETEKWEPGTGKAFTTGSRPRGVIMILAMFVMLIVAALVLGMLQLRSSELAALGSKMRQSASQYIADAGIEQAIWYLRIYKQPMWEWGDPNYTGVVTDDGSGSATGKVWGTRLNDNFPNGIFYQEKLVTPEITVTSATPSLCYCYLLNNDADTDDDAQIMLTRNGGLTWSSLGALGNELDGVNAWASTTNALTGVLSGDTIRVGFSFYSDGNLNDPGLYIDNVAIVSSGTCPANICTTSPATSFFYDNMENGIGNWEYWIEPNQNTTLPINCPSTCSGCCDNSTFPNDYPANSGNYYWIAFDPRFAASNEWIILGRGIYGTNTGKVEAKVQIVGGSSPYTVKILYWKRIM